MTSETVSRALLGVIINESLEEKETNNKRGKTRHWIQRREEKGFTQILLKSFGLRTRKRMKKC